MTTDTAGRFEGFESRLRDLTALLALPALWKGRDRDAILSGLVDVLSSLLRLDLTYVGPDQPETLDTARAQHRMHDPNHIAESLVSLAIEGDDIVRTVTLPDVGDMRVTRFELPVDDRRWGVLVGSGRNTFPTETERFLLRAAINQTTVALQTAALVRITEMLNRVGATVAGELDREKIVQTVTDVATDLTTAAFGAFFYNVVDARSGESYLLYTLSGASRDAFKNFPHPRATALFGPTFRGEAVVRSDDVTRDSRYGQNPPFHGMPAGHLPVRSYLAVPVKSRDGSVLGGLFFGHPDVGVFTNAHERLVTGIASWASVALENARLYEQAREANRAKDEFLAVLSHELRTPLNAISGWAHMLRDGHVTGKMAQHAITVIERNVRRQAQLVEDLLDVSRIVSGKLRLEISRVDLATVIASAIDAVRPLAAEKTIQIDFGAEPEVGPVNGDPSRVEQIIWNLLTNAVKFTNKGGRIDVNLRCVNGSAEIVVRDNGQGIAPDVLAQIFDRFWQADGGSARKHGGLGLGLALVRALTEAHGGTVQASSEGLGAGATFSVRLPMQEPVEDHPGRRRPPAMRAVRIDHVRALIVEDDPDARELLALTIKAAGAIAIVAGSVREALRLFEQEHPDILIADIGMPQQDGFDLIRQIRALPVEAARQTPAIALTAYASVKDREDVRRAGFDAHVSKPFEPDQLIAAIAEATRRK